MPSIWTAGDTGVDLRSNYEVQNALVDTGQYVDVLEQVVVIQDQCEVVINMA